jgi:hypothetical protein
MPDVQKLYDTWCEENAKTKGMPAFPEMAVRMPRDGAETGDILDENEW